MLIAICFGLFVLAKAVLDARAQVTRDRADVARSKAHEASMASIGEAHKSAMAGAYELMRDQGERHIDKMERVLGMVGDTVRELSAEKSMDTREVTIALRESTVVVERAVKVLDRIAPVGTNGAGSITK